MQRPRPARSLRRRSTLLVAAACVAAAVPVRAQTVVGTVSDAASLEPLAGAFVVLVDDEGARTAGVLTDGDGSYVLRAPGPGRYRLIAELIGYTTARSDWMELAPSASSRVDLRADIEALALEGIEVAAGERCRPRPGSGPATARLWEEARKALEVARWSDRRRALRYRIVEFERELDARTLRVAAERERPRRGWSDASPFRSLAAERLARDGYVQRDDDGGTSYYAPDADVLLSETFLETHCFRVAPPPPDEPELIGLGFEPLPGRELPDVEGVLWLERATGALRRLDFGYRNLADAPADGEALGGRIMFERLPSGVWIVRRWRIRMPLVITRDARLGGRPRLVSILEHGAEVRTITDAAGRPLGKERHPGPPRPDSVAVERGAVLLGTVLDEEGGGVAGATVTLADSAARVLATAATDPGGAFRLSARAAHAGTHTVAARALGYRDAARTVELRPGQVARTDLTLAPRPVELEPVVARERRRSRLAAVGFHERREQGLGRAIEREEIERRVPARVTDLFYGQPGVHVVPRDRSGTYWDVRPRGRECQPAIWLDDALVRNGGAPASGEVQLSDVISPDHVEAIEFFFHVAEIPTRYRGTGAACGVILIWTRSR